MNRQNQFSHDGLEILFNYLEDADPDMELDVIAICCDFAESDAYEIIQSYSLDLSDVDVDDNEALETLAREYLENEGVLVGMTASCDFIYRQF
jgi:hypothetical protein